MTHWRQTRAKLLGDVATSLCEAQVGQRVLSAKAVPCLKTLQVKGQYIMSRGTLDAIAVVKVMASKGERKPVYIWSTCETPRNAFLNKRIEWLAWGIKDTWVVMRWQWWSRTTIWTRDQHMLFPQCLYWRRPERRPQISEAQVLSETSWKHSDQLQFQNLKIDISEWHLKKL